MPVLANQQSPQTIPGASWAHFEVDEGVFPNGATLRILTALSIQPLGYVQQDQGQPPTDSLASLEWSRPPGNCALKGPGRWWVFNQNAIDVQVILERIDAGQSLAPDETPMHGVADSIAATTSGVANTVTQALPANRQRRSFTLWNRSTANTIRVGRGFQPGLNEGVPVFGGTSVTFPNGECCTGPIFVVAGAVSVPYTIEEVT